MNGKETVGAVSFDHDINAIAADDESDTIEKIVAGAQEPADSDQKWARRARCYMTGWGLDRIDEQFIRTHGVKTTCKNVVQLIRVLYPPLCADVTLDTSGNTRLSALRTPLIKEVIEALGFASPFDTCHRIPDLMAVWQERLKYTEYFAKYKQSSRLFGIQGNTAAWTLMTVSKALGTVLSSIGLHLDSSRTQRRVDGKKVNSFSYHLDPVMCSEMLELIRIKMRGSEYREATPNKQARELILCNEFPKYGHLIDRGKIEK